MAYNYEYPYVSSDRENADWLLNKVKELEKRLNEDIEKEVKEYVEKYLSRFVLEATYDPATETIKLYLKETEE